METLNAVVATRLLPPRVSRCSGAEVSRRYDAILVARSAARHAG